MTEQEKEATQPVIVSEEIPSQTPKEGIQPVEVNLDAAETKLPEWLLKFAASPEQSMDEIQDADNQELLTSFSDDVEETEAFIPPEFPNENEWQELSEFQDQDLLDLEAVEDSQETTAASDPVEELEESTTTNPQLEAAAQFGRELRSLLKQDQREDAIAFIRANKTDPSLAEAAKKTLRSQLTLSSEASDFWDVYDELNSSSD